MNTINKVEPYAKVVAKLLQSDIDDSDKLWRELLNYHIPVTEFFEKIGLELILNKDDGYAFLKQLELDDAGSTVGLIRRLPLTYEVSLVCVLLRELLDEFETGEAFSQTLFLTHKQIKEHIELFFKEKSSRVKFLRNMDSYINKVVELGFLRVRSQNEHIDERLYEVRRILKAKISLDALDEFKNQLQDYVESL